VNYIKSNPKHKHWASPAADGIFGVFAVTFIVSRLGFYPYYVLYNCVFVAIHAVQRSGVVVDPPIVFYLFNSLLSILQVSAYQ
jgi:TLC domain